jgi:hypothetical protein
MITSYFQGLTDQQPIEADYDPVVIASTAETA